MQDHMIWRAKSSFWTVRRTTFVRLSPDLRRIQFLINPVGRVLNSFLSGFIALVERQLIPTGRKTEQANNSTTAHQ